MPEATSRPAREPPGDRAARIFVAAVWAASSLLLVGFVAAFAVDMPLLDDWEVVPVLTGHQPLTLGWLWSQHNEHRIFLPRLLYLGTLELAGHDYRAGALVNALLLAVAAAWLAVAARAIRGRSVWADAFFPLLLLHWGQAENLVWGFTLALVLPSVVAIGVLPLLVRPGVPGPRAALALALGTAALPLVSGSGLALVPALAACCLVVAWQLRALRPRPRWRWLVPVAGAVVAMVLLGLYFVGYQRPSWHPVSPGPLATLTGTVQFLAVGFGSVAKYFWPAIGLFVVGLGVATAAVVVRAAARSPADRPRAARTLLFLGGLGCLALGTAWARIAVYPEGIFAPRYATLAAPALACVYLAWEMAERPVVARAAQGVLCGIAALFLAGNMAHGAFGAGALQRQRQGAVEALAGGAPLWRVAQRHCGAISVCGSPALLERMRMLRERDIGAFARGGERSPEARQAAERRRGSQRRR